MKHIRSSGSSYTSHSRFSLEPFLPRAVSPAKIAHGKLAHGNPTQGAPPAARVRSSGVPARVARGVAEYGAGRVIVPRSEGRHASSNNKSLMRGLVRAGGVVLVLPTPLLCQGFGERTHSPHYITPAIKYGVCLQNILQRMPVEYSASTPTIHAFKGWGPLHTNGLGPIRSNALP